MCHTLKTMKLQLLILFGLVIFVESDLGDQKQLESEWMNFKKVYKKQYRSYYEEQFRKQIFADNLEFIINHNQEYKLGLSTFKLGVNKFTDMTVLEFGRRMNGLIISKSANSAPSIYMDNDVESLPIEVDWTELGVVTPVKNQGNCGSCWAFAAVASIESAHALKNKSLVELSAQELVDCSEEEGDNGCYGGRIESAFKFVINNNGIDTEKSYPYRGYDELCRKNEKNKTIGATIHSYVNVKQFDEYALQSCVAKIGPVSVSIDASSPHFMMYESGVYDDDKCSSLSSNHGATVVGYGIQNGKQYWKVKNSWGTAWGDKGYILMSRNKKNQCGIATKASYPVV